MACKRSGNRWTVNEMNSLQREYELLEMDVFAIAKKHQRSVEGIIYKLYAEDMIGKKDFTNYLEMNKNATNGNKSMLYDACDDATEPSVMSNDDISRLSSRMGELEDNVRDISVAIQGLLKERVKERVKEGVKERVTKSCDSPVRSLRSRSSVH